MAFVYTGQMVDLGFGRGWMDGPAAASQFRIDRALGHPQQITEAGRTWAQQNDHFQIYLRDGYPIALSPDAPSLHQRGNAKDTNERYVALMNDHGWYQTVYRWVNGVWTLVEPWHFEYFYERDNHRFETAGNGSEDFDMPLNNQDLINILQAEFATGRKKTDGTGEYVSIATALGAVYFYGDLMNKLITALPDAVWSKPLKHALSEKMIPAGDFLRYEPAEHQSTRNALDGITVDVDPVVAAVREALTGIPGVDPAAVEKAAQAGAAAALQALTLKAV